MTSVRSTSRCGAEGRLFRSVLPACLFGAVCLAGCATMKAPTWPWAKNDALEAEKKVAGELGEDADHVEAAKVVERLGGAQIGGSSTTGQPS